MSVLIAAIKTTVGVTSTVTAPLIKETAALKNSVSGLALNMAGPAVKTETNALDVNV